MVSVYDYSLNIYLNSFWIQDFNGLTPPIKSIAFYLYFALSIKLEIICDKNAEKIIVYQTIVGNTFLTNLLTSKPSNSYFAALLNPNNFRSEITYRSDYQSDQEVTI